MKKFKSFYRSLFISGFIATTALTTQLPVHAKNDSVEIEKIMSPYYKKDFKKTEYLKNEMKSLKKLKLNNLKIQNMGSFKNSQLPLSSD